ncbi:MAG TPA: hypothetical protein VF920_07440, partial [Dongiaceae bacterium]
CNSIADSLRGEFGDHHGTNRTSGTELFINPLMAQYWTFDAGKVIHKMAFTDALAATDEMEAARQVIEREREALDIRPRRPLPL